MSINDIKKKYKNSLMITIDELKDYAKNRSEMNIIEFENVKKLNKPVKPIRFITVGGKYISDVEYKQIIGNGS